MAIQSFRPLNRARGHVRIETVEGLAYTIRLFDHEALMKALDGTAVWFNGIDNSGVKVRIRCSSVVGVETYTPEAIAACIAEHDASDEEDKARRLTGVEED